VPGHDEGLLISLGDQMIANTDPDLAAVLLDGGDSEQYRLLPFRSPAARGAHVVSASLGRGQGPLGLRVRTPAQPDPGLALVDVSATSLMVVPVHAGSWMVSLRCGRLPSGERVGIAFTAEASLARAMGADQPWIYMSAEAMRDMLAPLGVTRIQVDPGVITAGRPVSVSA